MRKLLILSLIVFGLTAQASNTPDEGYDDERRGNVGTGVDYDGGSFEDDQRRDSPGVDYDGGSYDDGLFADELDPYSKNINEVLEKLDKEFGGPDTYLPFNSIENDINAITNTRKCYRQTCTVWAQVSRSQQKLFLYVNGNRVNTWDVSTGTGNRTPNFDMHPNGRIYNRYSSSKYPGGDYNGLGNMPYAVFITGGFAIHGTPKSNWPKLGKKASHGCIRLHPDNGLIFNRLVREHGISNVWITVEE